MSKKVLFAIFIFFTSLSLFAQTDADGIESQNNKQAQTFSWAKVKGAKRYEVNVENFVNGNWVQELSVKTKECKIEVMLTPGKKRLSVSAYNAIGRKASTTPWIEFSVLTETKPDIDELKFPEYKNYNTRILKLSELQDGKLEIYGRGFNKSTIFSLVPSSAGIPYPFSTSIERKEVHLPITSMKLDPQGGGRRIAIVNVDFSSLRTGYYNLVADNPQGNDMILLLVDADGVFETETTVKKSQSTTISKSDQVTFTLKGLQITNNTKLTLISEFDKEIGENTRIPLSYVDLKTSGKKAVLQGDKDKLTPGFYALLIENENGSRKTFIKLKKGYKSSIEKLSSQEITNLFIRPENFVLVPRPVLSKDGKIVDRSTEKKEDISYTMSDYKVKLSNPLLFPSFIMEVSFYPNPFDIENMYETTMGFGFQILNFNWSRISVMAEYGILSGFAEAFGTFDLTLPNYYISPYVGIGYGVLADLAPVSKEFDNPNGFSFENIVWDETHLKQMAIARVGLNLVNFIDFNYTIRMAGVTEFFTKKDGYQNGESFFFDTFSLLINIPLRAPIYTKKPTMYEATFASKKEIDGKKYSLKKEVNKLRFENGVEVIKGFADSENLAEVYLPDTVKIIGENAFENCSGLNTINIPYGVTEIQANAFAGCTRLAEITLPSTIRKIDPTAFNYWSAQHQKIYYTWDENDGIERDLGTLKNSPLLRKAKTYRNSEVMEYEE